MKTYDSKLSNPKDVIGSDKLPLHLVPDTMTCFAALGFLEGALKYGQHNWRAAGVRASIYYAAMQRHQKKWWNGQDEDPTTRVHHLANALCCNAIILDAMVCNKLTDDRPPSAPIADLIDAFGEKVKHLKQLFKDHAPYHWSIADDPQLRAALDSGLVNEDDVAEARAMLRVAGYPAERCTRCEVQPCECEQGIPTYTKG